MSGKTAIERYVEARRLGNDGLLVIHQDNFAVGPELKYLSGNAGYVGWYCQHWQQYGVVLGIWDTGGYDWLAGHSREYLSVDLPEKPAPDIGPLSLVWRGEAS